MSEGGDRSKEKWTLSEGEGKEQPDRDRLWRQIERRSSWEFPLIEGVALLGFQISVRSDRVVTSLDASELPLRGLEAMRAFEALYDGLFVFDIDLYKLRGSLTLLPSPILTLWALVWTWPQTECLFSNPTLHQPSFRLACKMHGEYRWIATLLLLPTYSREASLTFLSQPHDETHSSRTERVAGNKNNLTWTNLTWNETQHNYPNGSPFNLSFISVRLDAGNYEYNFNLQNREWFLRSVKKGRVNAALRSDLFYYPFDLRLGHYEVHLL